MAFYENGDVRIQYEDTGSGFPLLLIPGGGLNSVISYFPERAPFNAIEEFKDEYRCTAIPANAFCPPTASIRARRAGLRRWVGEAILSGGAPDVSLAVLVSLKNRFSHTRPRRAFSRCPGGSAPAPGARRRAPGTACPSPAATIAGTAPAVVPRNTGDARPSPVRPGTAGSSAAGFGR